MNILVIGNVRPGHKALVELGHEIIVLMRQDHSHAPDVEFPYKCLVLMDNQASSDEYASVAETLNQFHSFDRVACFNDTYQEFAVIVAEHLRLPYPHTRKMVNTLNDKYQTRQQLAQYKLDDTHCTLIESEQAFRSFASPETFPFIIKPLDSNASSGVSKVNNPEEVSIAIKKLQQAGHSFPVIAESFLQGNEFSIEAMSEKGKHVIIGITQKIKDDETFIELGHIFPASLDKNTSSEINRFVKEVLSALNVTDGPSHTEIILTENGPRLVETHSRAGGDNIFRLMELATGINIYQYEARQLAGESVIEDLFENRHAKCTAAVKFIGLDFDEDTQLTSVDNLEAAQSLSGIDQLVIIKQAGDKLPTMRSSRERAAFAIATGENSDQAMERCQQALGVLNFNIAWKLQ